MECVHNVAFEVGGCQPYHVELILKCTACPILLLAQCLLWLSWFATMNFLLQLA